MGNMKTQNFHNNFPLISKDHLQLNRISTIIIFMQICAGMRYYGDDYMELKFPQSFSMAQIVCDQVSHDLRKQLSETEIGYLAMHIERVTSAELGKE